MKKTMTDSLFLIFNHDITPVQESDARDSLGVQQIINMPPDLKELWRQIPPDLSKISDYLNPVKDWLAGQARKNDYVLKNERNCLNGLPEITTILKICSNGYAGY